MKSIPLLINVVSLIICAQQAKGKYPNVGDPCCEEDWVNVTGIVVKAFTENGNDPSNPAFLKALKQWKDSLPEVHDNEDPEGTCLGSLYYKCEGQKCVCNNIGAFLSVLQDKDDPKSSSEEFQTCRGDKDTICLILNTNEYMGCSKAKGLACKEWQENKEYGRCESDPNVEELNANGKGDASSISGIWFLVFLAFGIVHSFGI